MRQQVAVAYRLGVVDRVLGRGYRHSVPARDILTEPWLDEYDKGWSDQREDMQA